MTPKPKHPGGRPPLPFSQDTVDTICTLIAEGASLKSILRTEKGMPSMPTILKWLENHKQFANQYARAREVQADTYADEITEISDSVKGETENAIVQAARLRVDARKWIASKLKPRKYGERIEVNQKSEVLLKDERDALRDKVLEAARTGPEAPPAVH